YVYDTNNNLISETEDYDADGIVDNKSIYKYIQIDQESETNNEDRLSLADVHRFYQHEKGFHLYTIDSNEIKHIKQKSNILEMAYEYEAEKYQVLADNKDLVTGETIEGVKPLYRFFNNDTGAHLYTMDLNEKKSIEANLPNYDFEGIKYYAFEFEPENLETIPVYRMPTTP
ncbi:MAG: hypothetical protein ACFCAD_11350, partial [Pleurocapsa sp.]